MYHMSLPYLHCVHHSGWSYQHTHVVLCIYYYNYHNNSYTLYSIDFYWVWSYVGYLLYQSIIICDTLCGWFVSPVVGNTQNVSRYKGWVNYTAGCPHMIHTIININTALKWHYRGRWYLLGVVVFTLKFGAQHSIVNTAAPNMYTRPI